MAKRKTGDHPDLKLVNPNAASIDSKRCFDPTFPLSF